MSTTKVTVLLTGATGYIGSAVLIGLLKGGFRVRCSVRSESSKSKLLAADTTPLFQAYVSSGDLLFQTVPDITADDAFVTAAVGCHYIIHCASPVPGAGGDLVEVAVKGTISILHAAEQTPSVTRVVITSSVAALQPYSRRFKDDPYNIALAEGRAADVDTMHSETRIADPPALPEDHSPFQAYDASKAKALNVVRDYAGSPQGSVAHYDIVTLCPGCVLGPNVLQHSRSEGLQGSNRVLNWLLQKDFTLNAGFNLPDDADAPINASFVHLQDVVEGHIHGLAVPIKGKHRNFILSSDGLNGPFVEDAVKILKERVPDVAAQCNFEGSLGTLPMKHDCKDTERDLLGHEMRPYADQVVDTMSWYWSLAA